MNLDQLIARCAIIQPSRVKKTVTWKHRDPIFDADGNFIRYGDENTDVFDIFIKNEMSAADVHFITSPHDHPEVDADEKTPMARRVHRLVTLGENGEEKIPYPAAASMRLSLLVVLCTAINEVEESGFLEGVIAENAGEEKN